MRLKKRYILIAIILIAVVLGLAFFSRRKSPTDKYVTAAVERGDLHQIVSATGAIIPPTEIDLNSMIAGKIAEMNVKIGDAVKKDEVLAKLDGKDLEIKLKEAEANLAAARADLNRLLVGAKDEDVAVSAVNVEKAKADYNNALKTLDNIKDQAAQDIKAADDNVKNVQEKTAKDIEVADESVRLYEDSLDNTKTAKSQAIENAKETAITDIETKMFVAEASVNAVYDILNDDDMENVMSVKDKTYIEKTDEYYYSSHKNITAARTALEYARADNSGESIKDALDKANSALNETFNTLLSCYNI